MLAYYEKGVSLGEPYACFLLAQLHLSGSKTVKVDKNKVVTYLEKAADGDYAPAMCELGDLYFTGKLVNKISRKPSLAIIKRWSMAISLRRLQPILLLVINKD